MTIEQIRSIADNGAFPGRIHPVELVETHISWVILTPDYAFKIKKPVAFGFLDFHSLEKRKWYCEEEVRLNRRLAPDLYIDVLPIGGSPSSGLAIDESARLVVDYAVRMHRMDDHLQMDKMLAQNQVVPAHLEQLAAVLVRFHRQVVMSGAIVYDPGAYWTDFVELYRLKADIEQHLGSAAITKMNRWRSSLPAFLEQHAGRLVGRVRDGFWVDGHGDLHTRNIFLTGNGPLVFDCIEFNPHFRQLDILNELAFLCMDLDARGRSDLAEIFLQAYSKRWNVLPKQEDQQLFLFFKAYRANVRLKVALLELQQHATPILEAQVRQYWHLLITYLSAFQ